MEQKNLKKIGQVFSDYETKANIKEVKIQEMNLIKKDNVLEVKLQSEEYIDIKEIWFFEKFLRERFRLNNIDINIKYEETVKIKPIQEEWSNLICYMIHKYPLMRPMILLKSTIEIDKNNINVNMKIKGADFLRARKLDKELEREIKNLFGLDYKINFIEILSKEEQKEIEEREEREKQEIINRIIEEDIQRQKENNDTANHQEQNVPINDEVSITEELPIVEEDIELILGRLSKAKENKKKIKDISDKDIRVTIEGRIVTSEVRETKTGKGMLTFEIFDGTGIITCKAFTKDIEEGNDALEKIKSSEGIKATGKAGLDTYAGDITIIVNTVLKIKGDNLPKMPEEDDSTPLILGVTEVMKGTPTQITDLNEESGLVII